MKEVRQAFEGSPLVKIDCKGMHASDYKKLGGKLMVRCRISLIGYSSQEYDVFVGHIETKTMSETSFM